MPLPPYPGSTPAHIEAELETLAAAGWAIYKHSEPLWFVVALGDLVRVDIQYSSLMKRWDLVTHVEGNWTLPDRQANDATAVRVALQRIAKDRGFDMQQPPTSIRLSAATPLSNRLGIVSMCGAASVAAIFDPYFDDRAMANVALLRRLGLALLPAIRVLTTSKVRGRLSSKTVADLKLETGTELSFRECQSDKEHRRFILLSDGHVVVLGCSLNDLAKNEAAHAESNPHDATFFEAEWQQANQLHLV